MAPDSPRTHAEGQKLGDYLKQCRQALGLTLREVEARTNKSVTNGYLSQIEKNTVNRPSPNVLFNLANVYGLDYSDLLKRAGHHVPTASVHDASTTHEESLAGIPLRALQELTDEERQELTQYIAFIRQRRQG